MSKILISIVTTDSVPWRRRIAKIKELGIKEIAFFPTCLKNDERVEAYRLLSEIPELKIPLVHARADMTSQEFELLTNSFSTEYFNIHSQKQYPYPEIADGYRRKILIENSYEGPFCQTEIDSFGGICLDFAHLENDKQIFPALYKNNLEVLNNNEVAANHISGVIAEGWFDEREQLFRHDKHWVEGDLSRVDYLKELPKEYFGKYLALELNDDVEEQVKIKEYLEKMLDI